MPNFSLHDWWDIILITIALFSLVGWMVRYQEKADAKELADRIRNQEKTDRDHKGN